MGYEPETPLPASIDWRTKGAVTPIKDQGQCGSCWAFSAIASAEGAHAIKDGKLVSFSEQQLVDCAFPHTFPDGQTYENGGCNGGSMDLAFMDIMEEGGLETEKEYPYVEKAYGNITEKCQFKKKEYSAKFSSLVDINNGTELALKIAVATVGPISVGIDASQPSFHSYAGGIYYDEFCNMQQPDHGVAVVGYGSDGPGKDYWLVKNSWGTDWGEKGYIKMARNRDNDCGIAYIPSYIKAA